MAQSILAVVEDLIFLSKIQETAKLLGIEIETVAPSAAKARVTERLDAIQKGAVILDLNHRSGQAVALLKELKGDPVTRQIVVVGFLSHVQAELAADARAAGCDVLLARSAFAQKLPELLQRYAGIPASPRSPSSRTDHPDA